MVISTFLTYLLINMCKNVFDSKDKSWNWCALEYSLEKEMATHSSILAWRIPGTAEPGGLPSLGSHRVGHDWSNLAAAAAEYSYFPQWLSSKELSCIAGDAEDVGLIPGSGKSPGGRNGNLLHYSCLESPMDRSYNSWAHKERDTTELWNKENIHIFDFTRHCYVDLVNSGSLSVVSDSLQFHGLYSLALLRGIFPTQGSNPGLPHCRRILYQLSHQRSPVEFKL